MKTHTVLSLIMLLFFAWSLSAVVQSRKRLHVFRAEISASVGQSPADAVKVVSLQSDSSTRVPAELLRLRAEVTQLSTRKRQLASVHGRPSSNHLSAGVDWASTNIVPLPAGYVRKSKARFLGYSSPENTLETLLWALDKRDANVLLNAFTHEAATTVQEHFARSGEDFFSSAGLIPGMVILTNEQTADDSVKLEVETVPGMPPGDLYLKLVSGEWKIAQPF